MPLLLPPFSFSVIILLMRQHRVCLFFYYHRCCHLLSSWSNQRVAVMELKVQSKLFLLIRDGRKVGGWLPRPYHLLAILSPPERLCIRAGSCVRQFNVSLIVWAKSINRNFIRGSNRGPAYQHSARSLVSIENFTTIDPPPPLFPGLTAITSPSRLLHVIFVT